MCKLVDVIRYTILSHNFRFLLLWNLVQLLFRLCVIISRNSQIHHKTKFRFTSA